MAARLAIMVPRRLMRRMSSHTRGVDLFHWHVARAGQPRVGRVVVQDVEAAERLRRRVDHGDDRGFVAQVDTAARWHGRPLPRYARNRTLRGGEVDVGHRHRRAFARQHQRAGRADAAARAGHQCGLALDASFAS